MDTFGLVGMPLSHSFSKSFFTKKFDSEGIDAQYLNFELPEIGQIADILASHPDLKGFNVTIPYKEKILPHLDDINKDAADVGAVNVVKVSREGTGVARLCGYNSDIVGFEQSLRPLLKEWHHKALVLGTGGASKAVIHVLRKLGIDATLVSRNAGKGRITYSDISRKTMADNLLIINTTPLGMSPHIDACPSIPYEYLTPRHLCYDLIYNPEVTLFLKKAQEKGATIKNGEEMLILQAIESWRIWND